MLDAIAFDAAYRRHASALAAVSARLTNGSADAEDIAQDAWLALWRGREGIDLSFGVWGWLVRTLKRSWWHRCNPVRYIRQDGAKARMPGPIEVEESASPELEADGGQEGAVMRAALSSAIESMTKPSGRPVSDAMKNTMRLATTLDFPSEIAKARGVATSTVETMLSRGVEIIRRAWRIAD